MLIIDIQLDYKQWISQELESKIKEESKHYSSVIYLYDDMNGSDIYTQMPYEWIDDEEFYDSLNILTKQYGFFRTFMDIGFEEEDIINLGKFLIKHKLTDTKEIKEHNDIQKLYLKEFKNSEMLNYSFEKYSFWMPSELIESIDKYIHQGVVLVGGSQSACLKEISLLLSMMDIQHSINEELTYN